LAQIVLVGNALRDSLVDEPHDRCDLDCGALETLLLVARPFKRLRVLPHFVSRPHPQ
jgi:hypothetical protein